jgi:hypothetical protein
MRDRETDGQTETNTQTDTTILRTNNNTRYDDYSAGTGSARYLALPRLLESVGRMCTLPPPPPQYRGIPCSIYSAHPIVAAATATAALLCYSCWKLLLLFLLSHDHHDYYSPSNYYHYYFLIPLNYFSSRYSILLTTVYCYTK